MNTAALTGTVTSFPALADAFSGTSSIAHVAAGSGVGTTIVFVNTGSAAANLSIQFFGDDEPVPSLR